MSSFTTVWCEIVADDDPPLFDIEAFNPELHEYGEFVSGVPRADNFLKRSAKRFQKDGMARTWVAVRPGAPKVIGYYSINAMGFDASDLPNALAKRAPAHGKVPGLFLSWLAVDLTTQGLGLGRALLADVRQRAIDVAQQIGVAVIVLDVLDDDDEEAITKRMAFYKAWGYQSFPSTPLRMFRAIHR